MKGWFTRASSNASSKSIDLESGVAGVSPKNAVGESGSPGRVAWGEDLAVERHLGDVPGKALLRFCFWPAIAAVV